MLVNLTHRASKYSFHHQSCGKTCLFPFQIASVCQVMSSCAGDAKLSGKATQHDATRRLTAGAPPLIERDRETCLYQRPGMKRAVKAQLPDRSNIPWLIKYSNPPADLRASLPVHTRRTAIGVRCCATCGVRRASHCIGTDRRGSSKTDG